MAKKKVLHLIARMNVGGTATYIANLLKGMQGGPFENLLALGTVPKGEVEDPIVAELPIRRISGLSREISPSDFGARREFQRLVEKFKPDLIHSHTFKAGVIARTIDFSGLRVHSFHGHHLYDPEFGRMKVAVLNLIERRLVSRTDRFISTGKRVRDELVDVGIGSKDQYVCIAPGIKSIEPRDRQESLDLLAIDGAKPIIVWLGRFTQVKRPDRVVELATQLPQYDFVMAGGGELETGIKARAIPNLHCVGWQKKEVMWSIADLGIATSDSEGMPLSLIEAQMAGVPVVSTDVGSVNEIVVTGETGLLVPRDGEGMAGAIEKVFHSMERGEMDREGIKSHAERLFGISTLVSAHENLYRELLG